MPESKYRAQCSPSPKAPSVLPPLSKFYYGPAQGWASTESSPSHNGSTWSLNHNPEIPPTIPPRLSPGIPAYTSPQWSNNFPQAEESAQGWHSPTPLPPAPSPGHYTNMAFSSNSYAFMPGASYEPVNTTWDSGPPDTSTWGANYKHKYTQPCAPEPIAKPQLPPRANLPSDQHASYASKVSPSRLSATTIDVPLFLQPVAYDPESAPPIPGRTPSPGQGIQSPTSPPPPQKSPPPPPRKIPLDQEDEPQAPKVSLRRPQYDPEHSYDERPQSPQKLRRPRFDPQNSHDTKAGTSSLQWESQEKRPKIPIPHFSTFSVDVALPQAQIPHEAPMPLQQSQSPSTIINHNINSDGVQAGQRSHQSSIPSIGTSDSGRWLPGSKPWDSNMAYAPSTEQHHAVLSHDGQSVSTMDLSSTTAGKSTPESQQTSNTSYRENENHVDQTKQAQHGDDSFYWNSGRSSSDADGDQSQIGSPTAPPGESVVGTGSSMKTLTAVPPKHEALPTRSTSLSPVPAAPYGASALGFGGPSDWEYFGDYEAEEIDDEELYSRPKPRESANAQSASAEIPEETTASQAMQQGQEPETRDPGLDSGKKQSLLDRAPVEQPQPGASQDGVAQNESRPGPSDHSTAHSRLQSHDIGSDADMASDTSPDQRPDLDDVIRAWSEAPYVGKIEDSREEFVDNINEPAGVAEASLASTPQERMLGIDVILRDAPSLPKLPASLEQVNPPEDQRQPSNEALRTNKDISLVHEEDKEQIALNLKQPTAFNDISETPDVLQSQEQGLNYIRADKDQLPHPVQPLPGDDITSKVHHHTERTGSNIDYSLKVVTLVSGDNKSDMTCSDTIAQNVSHASLQDKSSDFPSTTSQNVTEKALEDDQPDNLHSAQLADKRNLQEDLTEPQQPAVQEDPATKASLENSQTASREVPQFAQPESRQEIVHKTLSPASNAVSPRSSKEELRSLIHVRPSHQHSYERLKQPDAIHSVEHTRREARTDGEVAQEKLAAQHVGPSVPAEGVSSQVVQSCEPYADLDPWGKASLNRFAAMLREEARAESNKDKLNIFNVFTSRESRLRVLLYGTDEELLTPLKPVGQKSEAQKKPEKTGFVQQAVQRANTMNLQRSLKALPALPSNRDSTIGLPGKTLAPLVIQDAPNSKTKGETPHTSGEESPSNTAQYSPGGRPIISSRLSRIGTESGTGSMQHKRTSSTRSGTVPSGVVRSINVVHSPSSDAPIAVGIEAVEDSKKPTYTPIKYDVGRSEIKNYLTNRKSICRPYATLTQGSFESGSNFGRETNNKLPSNVDTPITAPTSQYNPNLQVKGDDASDTTMKQKPTELEAETDLRRFVKADFDPLILVLPESEAIIPDSTRLADLRNVIDAVPDDFSFIHQCVVAWDAKAKKQREENERQRHARQVESEQRIDSLFDDHEIGYGDISELEAEFKQSEAARKADEDRSEYQTFVAEVFNVVWTRLHYELDQLVPHYEQYSKLMNDTLAGKDMFEGSDDGLALAPTMNAFLGLHQKLEIRHQKAFEAVLERDRRLKKTEISPWYTLSNIAKVKQLEKQFEDAEKKAIIEYCEQRDVRANRLMDVLDQNTLRGVGANQDYMEAIMKAVRRIASGRAFASVPGSNEPTAGLEEVQKAKAVTTLLATSSEQIVQTFHVADMLLNSADYEVSVARAKVAKADQATLAKLNEERMKEDQKLMRDLEHRLALIREDSRRTNDEIVKLMLFLGVQNGRADSRPPQAGSADAGHEARIQKALEEAKKRNALKESDG